MSANCTTHTCTCTCNFRGFTNPKLKCRQYLLIQAHTEIYLEGGEHWDFPRAHAQVPAIDNPIILCASFPAYLQCICICTCTCTTHSILTFTLEPLFEESEEHRATVVTEGPGSPVGVHRQQVRANGVIIFLLGFGCSVHV